MSRMGWLVLALLILTGCDSSTKDTPSLDSNETPESDSPIVRTPRALPPTRTPSPPPTPAVPTVITQDEANLVVSQPQFFWTLKLPKDWLITYDSGFEFKANNPAQTVDMRLLSQQWETEEERLPHGVAYVLYWKKSPYGNLFPIQAEGEEQSRGQISEDKFGGPYLQYEFMDEEKGMYYWQVYASAGGPNSLVVTVSAKLDDVDRVQDIADGILNSVELLKGP